MHLCLNNVIIILLLINIQGLCKKRDGYEKNNIKKMLRKERGISLTGYGLMVGLIGVIAISAIGRTGSAVNILFGGVGNALEFVTGGGSGGVRVLLFPPQSKYMWAIQHQQIQQNAALPTHVY